MTQRQSLHYTGSPQLLYFYLSQLAGELEHLDPEEEKKDTPLLSVKAFDAITVQLIPPVCTLEVRFGVQLKKILFFCGAEFQWYMISVTYIQCGFDLLHTSNDILNKKSH